MSLGWKVLRASVCLLGVFVGSLRAQEHNCEKELIPVVDSSITDVEFQKVLLYEHSNDTGLTARVANRSSKTIVAVYTAFETYSRSGEYLLSLTAISSSDKGHSKLATREIPYGLEPGETSLSAKLQPGNETNIHAYSALSLATCDVALKVRRLWLEFEDHSVVVAEGKDWNSDALPTGREEVHDPLPKECHDLRFELMVAADGKATTSAISSDCKAVQGMFEATQFAPALHDRKPVPRSYKVVFRGKDDSSSLTDQDFGDAESLVVVTTSSPKCGPGIFVLWGDQDLIYPPTFINPLECPETSRSITPHN